MRAAGAEAEIAQGDVAEDADCRKIAAVAARYGRIDALANNAGITKQAQNHADLDALSKEDFLRLYAVNTVGPFQMIRACRSLLEAARSPERADDVVHRRRHRHRLVGGLRRLQGRAQHHDAVARPRAGAQDPRQRHLPGFIDTRWFSGAFSEETTQRIRDNVTKNTPLKAASKPEDIADAALFLISDAARHITGETLMIDAGMHLGFAPMTRR